MKYVNMHEKYAYVHRKYAKYVKCAQDRLITLFTFITFYL